MSVTNLEDVPAYHLVPWCIAKKGNLRTRVCIYRSLVAEGICDNLRDAVKIMHARWRLNRETARRQDIEFWHNEQARKYKRRLRRFTEIVHADGRPCAYCGDPNPRTVDHVDPFLPRGGADELDNLVPCCRQCNSEKGERTPAEWRSVRLAAGLVWPPEPSAERPRIPAHLSFYKVTSVQKELLSTLALQGHGSVQLDRQFMEASIGAAERHRLIERLAGTPTRFKITDLGRLALETGRIPRWSPKKPTSAREADPS